MTPFKAQKITDDVFWVGAIDWSLRDFHGYAIHHGTTYNAFLILADKITLIDTVKAPFKHEMLSRISSIINPEKIECIVSNHSELDHTGCLPDVIRLIRPEQILASTMGQKALMEHFPIEQEITAVKDGENLSLGNKTLTFIETRMLHWPDSMFTYLKEDRILFSQDAFGMHLATSERFNDELEFGLLKREAAKYFANILLPYAALIPKMAAKLESLNVASGIIAPDHGPIWRKDAAAILKLYSRWAQLKPTRKAVIVFDTMWQSTAKMAAAIAEGLISKGVKVELMHLGASHRSDVATELLDAGALIVGSPTINNNLFPTVADTFTYIKGLKRRGLIGAAFGSYGWGGEAVKQIEVALDEMKVERIAESVKVKYVPDDEALQNCFNLGVQVAEELLKRTQ